MKLKPYLAGLEHGAAKKLADALGISPSYLSQLAAGSTNISPARCVQIERETAGKVTRKDLRDDWASIWPELSEADAA